MMTFDNKVAFVWGIGNFVEFERALRETPPPQSKGFMPLLIQGLAGKTINEVVHEIDAYYKAHPDRLERSGLGAMFQAVVLPTMGATRQGG
jgi:hypothetical protein